jgi:hypothetical protein
MPVPSETELSNYYSTYNDHYAGGGSSGGANMVRYATRYVGLVKRFSSGGSLLDIGCSNSPFPNLAARAGFEVTAMDYSRPRGLAPNIAFITGSLNGGHQHLPFKKYGTVTAWAVLEHVADPHLAFEVFEHVLADGGALHIVTCEYGTNIERRIAGRTRWFYPPEHLHLLTPKAIKILAESHGLRVQIGARFEISPLRWLVRYGAGFCECVIGACLKSASKSLWRDIRNAHVARYLGIYYYRLSRALH